MRTPYALLPAILLAAIGTGCEPAPIGDGDVDAYRAVLPDERVQINLDTDYDGSRAVGDLAEAYLFTAQVTRDVNGMIGSVLGIVDLATDYEPTWASHEENTAVWGPWADSLDASESALWVHYDEPTDVYTWAIAQRPRGEEDWDAFEPIVVGQVNEGATDTDSDGWFYFDFDAAATYDPVSTTEGKFATHYDIDPDAVEATAGFEDFSDDGEGPINAVYAFSQDSAGGAMDLIYEADIDGNGSAIETHYARSRWMADGSGRGDAAVAGGDLGEFVGYSSECWDAAPDFGRSFYGNNWDTESIEGDASNCVFTDEDFSDDAPEDASR